MVPGPLCSRLRRPLPKTRRKKCCSFYLINFSLEFQTPYPYTFLLLIKRVCLKWNLRPSVTVHNLPSSQITGHLNKAPIKIPSLSLLIGSGSDRLSWFQGKGLDHMISSERLGDLNPMTSDMLGEERSLPTIFALPVLPITRPPGHSALVTF